MSVWGRPCSAPWPPAPAPLWPSTWPTKTRVRARTRCHLDRQRGRPRGRRAGDRRDRWRCRVRLRLVRFHEGPRPCLLPHHAPGRYHRDRGSSAADSDHALAPVTLVAEERTLKGSYIGTAVPNRDIPRYIQLYQRGLLPVDRLLTGTLDLKDINEGFDRLHDGRRFARWWSYDESPMSSDPWEEMTKRWREVYQEQAALAQKNWLDGQSQLATALAGGAMSDPSASAAAMAQLWRSWTTFGDRPALSGDHPGAAEISVAPPAGGTLGRRAAGYAGAMFPWQSGSDGREETPRLHFNPRLGPLAGRPLAPATPCRAGCGLQRLAALPGHRGHRFPGGVRRRAAAGGRPVLRLARPHRRRIRAVPRSAP